MPKLVKKRVGYAYLGIDPGLGGGFAVISNCVIMEATPMLATEMECHQWMASIKNMYPSIQACIEQIQPAIFGVGKTSMSKLYGNYMACRMLLVCNSIPFIEVPPKVWQAQIGMFKKKNENQNKWKDRLRQKAQNMYPTFSGWLHEPLYVQKAFSDAVLLARYAQTYRD